MFGLLLCKRLQLLSPNGRNTVDSTSHLILLAFNHPASIIRLFSSIDKQSKRAQKCAFTVSYLVNSHGLSLESAKSISLRFNFNDAERASLILNFLKSYGFTTPQITKVIRSHPNVLSANVEQTLFPKFEFLSSIGLSREDLAKVVSSHPRILSRNLNQKLIPLYNYLNSILSADDVVKVVKRSSWILSQMDVPSKVSVLRGVGVPQSYIAQLLTHSPRIFSLAIDKFESQVKEVMCMGFSPSTGNFIKAFRVFGPTQQSTWDRKKKFYRRLGWTEDDFVSAFKKEPTFMAFSENRIANMLEFLVNKMGWLPGDVARIPVVLNYSLECRIMPRCWVIKVLQSNGLIKGKVSLATVVVSSEKYFLNTFVIKYQEQLPELLTIFRREITLPDLHLRSEEKLDAREIVSNKLLLVAYPMDTYFFT